MAKKRQVPETRYERMMNQKRKRFKIGKVKHPGRTILTDHNKRICLLYISRPYDGYNWKIITQSLNVYGLIVQNVISTGMIGGKGEKREVRTGIAKSKFLYNAKVGATLLSVGSKEHYEVFLETINNVIKECGFNYNNKPRARTKTSWEKLPENVKKVINKTLKID